MTATSPSTHLPYTLGSKLASVTVLLLIFLAYTLSLWQEADKGGEGGSSSLSWSADGVIGVVYAVPLFLASTIVCVQYARTKAFYPFATGSNAQRSPDRVLFWLRVLIVVGNIVQFAPHLEFHGSGGGDMAVGAGAKRGPKQDVDASITPSSTLSTSSSSFWGGLEGVSKAAGLPVFWNVGWLFVLAMRSPALAPLQATLGLGYEHTIALHRLMGWSTTFWLMLHSIGYIVAHLAEGRATTMLLPGSDKSNMNVVGWSLLLVFMAMTALYQVRRRNYSLFALFHWLWIPFALCCILHVPQDAMVILPTVALYIIDRLLLVIGAGAGVLGGTRVTAIAIRVAADVVALLIPVG
ncbi:ferric/cupric-chelate reductase [Allomyces arbusculus]|nr:ferric/cupric-chelate reductase [Allomyces arbusculus]